ncbi:MAG: PepSY domain-containing protein, partial [Firmicutes bacterium]|nr:PepSY domain-containing protein [Bacillota bacterium]
TASETKNTLPDSSAFIGEERAKEIALEKAGLSADEVFFDRVELDRDRNVYVYEVEFRKNRTEYDAEIKKG